MKNIGFPTVFRAINDLEGAQYQLLACTQNAMQAFATNVVYPHLAEMVALYNSFVELSKKIDDARSGVRGELQKIDLVEGHLLYDNTGVSDSQMETIDNFIQWALPYIRRTIDEGRTIFEFVDEHMLVAEVGVIPTYLEEGYLIIPNRETRVVNVVRYELSVYTSMHENYRSLKTEVIRQLPNGLIEQSPATIKMQLVEELSDLPNPATYFAETDLDFPFAGTVLPIAKRKLLKRLSSAS